ncbi:MAG: hypothetical protein E6G72_07260 [Alphaproteobacteria bacterium]|nr:MAG: hypothetical protein E6G72_07260 [Alphaproteobacteria bacterium]
MSELPSTLITRIGGGAAVGDYVQILKPRVMSLVVFTGFVGLAVAPRRISDYPEAFAGWNMVSSIGAFISYASTLFFIFIVFHTFAFGKRVGANYWGPGATTLEWSLSSPPPFHSFEEVPVIAPAPAGH